ncbi:SMI1/KNR4 family protein [Vibrio barjaei]|jgi:hypothetical protein|uniref:SMI1/KNR4 family protein n=1 Tax=Vibrio barjaei TaxID=1676683 RepID=A0ABW7IJ18_9VIBR
MKSEELSRIERKTGIVLPQSYKQALLNYPEDLVDTEAEDYHFLTDADEIISENLEVRVSGYFGEKWPERYFIIGHNGCGDYYVISHTSTEFSVGFTDHNKMECKLFADSLDEFVEKVLNEFETK